MQGSNLNETAILRSDMEGIIEKGGEKLKNFEMQFREVNENLKMLNRASSQKRHEGSHNKENNSEAIKDKVNEIKP